MNMCYPLSIAHCSYVNMDWQFLHSMQCRCRCNNTISKNYTTTNRWRWWWWWEWWYNPRWENGAQRSLLTKFDICCHLNPVITMPNSVWSMELEIGIHCLATNRPFYLFLLELNTEYMKYWSKVLWNEICSICCWWCFCCISESNFFFSSFGFFPSCETYFNVMYASTKSPKLFWTSNVHIATISSMFNVSNIIINIHAAAGYWLLAECQW